MKTQRTYKAVVLGTSAGGFKVIKQLVNLLPAGFSIPVAIVQHVSDSSDGKWAGLLNEQSKLHVKEADEKEQLKAGYVYLAPANYHLLIEPDHTFTLTVDERVNYARPSIDVLFETAAEAYGDTLIGIVCTGANFDGAQGLKYIKEKGGLTIVQDPATAESTAMPLAAINAAGPHHIISVAEIINLLISVHNNQSTDNEL